jgi:hypothetical protein
MTKAFRAVYEMGTAKQVNMRQAAYLVAVARVAEACKLRGWSKYWILCTARLFGAQGKKALRLFRFR